MRDAVDRPDEGSAVPEPRPADVTDGPKLGLPEGAGSRDHGCVLMGDEGDEGFGGPADLDKQGYKLLGDSADDSDLCDEAEAGEAELPIRELVEKSLRETVSETGEWVFETGLVLVAHCICPPAGHLVTLVFEAKEVLGDVAVLASQDGPGELKIPLVHLAPGIEVEAGLQLGDEDETDSPRLSVFVVPGDGGVFGGWALGRDPGQEAAGQEETKTDQDTPDGAAVFGVDLSQAVDATQDPEKRAAILRGTASRMQSQLWAMPEYGKTSMMVFYDEHAELGMWLARPQAAAKASAWRLELESGAERGLLKTRLLA
jgi:hypothetical protein